MDAGDAAHAGDQVCQQTSNLGEREWDKAVAVGASAPFSTATAAVMARNACAHIANVMCRYQGR